MALTRQSTSKRNARVQSKLKEHRYGAHRKDEQKNSEIAHILPRITQKTLLQ
jgi:hypothetical protein